MVFFLSTIECQIFFEFLETHFEQIFKDTSAMHKYEKIGFKYYVLIKRIFTPSGINTTSDPYQLSLIYPNMNVFTDKKRLYIYVIFRRLI